MSADRYRRSNGSSGYKVRASSPQCIVVQAKLLDYVDSALSASDKRAVESHIEQCQTCTVELSQIRRAEAALVSAALSVPVPGSLYEGFSAKLTSRQTYENRRAFRWMAAAPAFALAIIAIVYATGGRRHGLTEVSGIPAPTPRVVASLSDPSSFGLQHHPFTQLESGAYHGASTTSTHNAQSRFSRRAPSLANKRTSGPNVMLRFATSRFRNSVPGIKWQLAEQPVASLAAVNGVQQEGIAYTRVDVKATFEMNTIRERSYGNNYRYELPYTDSYQVLALRTPDATLGYNPIAGEAREAENLDRFALVVQDDVRGFSAESHDAASPSQRTSGDGTSGGVRIEVEYDGASNTSSF